MSRRRVNIAGLYPDIIIILHPLVLDIFAETLAIEALQNLITRNFHCLK